MTARVQHGGCPATGKVRYRNRNACRGAIDTTRYRFVQSSFGRAVPPTLRAYRCRWCRGWHMTSRPPVTRRKGARG